MNYNMHYESGRIPGTTAKTNTMSYTGVIGDDPLRDKRALNYWMYPRYSAVESDSPTVDFQFGRGDLGAREQVEPYIGLPDSDTDVIYRGGGKNLTHGALLQNNNSKQPLPRKQSKPKLYKIVI